MTARTAPPRSLTDEQIVVLRARVRADEVGVLAAVQISRETLHRALAGLQCRSSTIAVLERFVAAPAVEEGRAAE